MRYGTDSRSFFFFFAVCVGAIPLALFLASLTAPFWYFAELIVSFRCQIGIAMVPFALLLMRLQMRWLSAFYSMATIVCLSPILLSYIPASQPPAGSRTLRVATFNMYAANERYEAELKNIKEIDPDILLVTEYTGAWAREMKELETIYRYHILEPRNHGFGIALLSKFPLEDTETILLGKKKKVSDIPLLRATAIIGDQRLRLIGLHTLSPSPENSRRVATRNEQIIQAASYVDPSGPPTLLLGDLNCVPWSSFMKPLYRAGLRDTRRGFGYQATWHRLMKPLRIPIDHVFVSDEIHVHDRWVGHSSGSDHFPVVTIISIGGAP